VLALLLLAVALGLSNFAAAIGIGVSGVRGRARVQIAVVFGVFEAGMPVLGVALGQGVAASLGQAARWLSGAALIVIGLTSLILAQRGAHGVRDGGSARDGRRARDGRGARVAGGACVAGGARVAGGRAGDGGSGPDGDGSSWRLGRIVVSGLALSVDNLAAGFALGAYHTGLALAATVFGAVSVIMTLAGLELGARLGARTGDRSELIASVMLIAVGIAVAVGVF
jgi:manganese efflux pump family protein